MYEALSNVRVILWMVLHHRWMALVVAGLIGLAGWTVVILLPNQYEVRARVYLDTDSVLQPLLRGLAIDNSMQEQAAIVVRRTLLTRPNLAQVMRVTDLDLQAESEVDREAMLIRLAGSIQVDGHADKRREDANIYTITFRHNDARTAHDVVDALLDVFLEGVLGTTRMDTSKAQDFLDQQIAEYRSRLEAMESALKEFKHNHPEVMQLQGAGYYARLEQARIQLADARLVLNEAERRVADLARQRSEVSETLAAGNSDLPVQEELSPLAKRIEPLRLRLDELLLQYTEQHPDVAATRAALEQLEAELDRERAARAADPVQAQAEQLRVNPVYQGLSTALSEARAEVASVRARVDEYQKRAGDLEAAVDTLPDLLDQYQKLARNYDVTQETYDTLVQRRESAQISQSADETGEQVRFRVIEPPTVPMIPVWPNRPLFHAGVTLAALVAGMGAAWLLSQLRPTFYTREQLSDEFGVPVLGTVSMVWSDDELSRRRYGIVGYGVSGAVFFALFAMAMAYSLFIQGAR